MALHGHFVKRNVIAGSDQALYLSIASDLATTGRFTNGLMDGHRPPERPSGMFYPPAYPWLVSLVARVDPRLAATARCVADPAGGPIAACPVDLGLLVPVQIALAAGTLLLVWLSAWVVSRSEPVAWAALALAAFGCYEYAAFAHRALTEALTCPLLAGFSLCLLLAVQSKSPLAAVGAGMLLGLASLTRPGYLYLAYAIAAMVAGAALFLLLPAARRRLRRWIGLGALLSAATALVVTPWMIRNAAALGIVDLTSGYGGFSLAQRVAYDAMTSEEFLAAWIYWLPDFGHSLARALFAPDAYRRLGWDESPATYYSIGNAVIAPATLAAAGSPAAQVSYIVHTMILPHLPKFILVTIVLAWRGLWFGKYFSLLAFPMFVGATAAQLCRRRLDLAVLAAPSLFMLFFQAAVSVSTARYNVSFIPAFSIAAALCLVALFERLTGRRGHAATARSAPSFSPSRHHL